MIRHVGSFIVSFFLLFTAPAFAMDQYEYNLEMQRMQLEQARIQANGMALMGSGPAFINGMQQAFRPLPMPVMPTVQPYNVPVPREPIRCISQTYGANIPAVTCY